MAGSERRPSPVGARSISPWRSRGRSPTLNDSGCATMVGAGTRPRPPADVREPADAASPAAGPVAGECRRRPHRCSRSAAEPAGARRRPVTGGEAWRCPRSARRPSSRSQWSQTRGRMRLRRRTIRTGPVRLERHAAIGLRDTLLVLAAPGAIDDDGLHGFTSGPSYRWSAGCMGLSGRTRPARSRVLDGRGRPAGEGGPDVDGVGVDQPEGDDLPVCRMHARRAPIGELGATIPASFRNHAATLRQTDPIGRSARPELTLRPFGNRLARGSGSGAGDDAQAGAPSPASRRRLRWAAASSERRCVGIAVAARSRVAG